MMRVFIEREGVIVEVDRESSAFSFLKWKRETLCVVRVEEEDCERERRVRVSREAMEKEEENGEKDKKREEEVRELLYSVRVFVDACIL